MSRRRRYVQAEYLPEKAWRLFGADVASEFAGQPVVPIPFLNKYEIKCPCVPGSVIFGFEQSIWKRMKRKPKNVVFTEGIWDFNPLDLMDPGKNFLVSRRVEENNEHALTYRNNFWKRYFRLTFGKREAQITLKGRAVEELLIPDSLNSWEIDLSLLDEAAGDVSGRINWRVNFGNEAVGVV